MIHRFCFNSQKIDFDHTWAQEGVSPDDPPLNRP